MTEFSIGDTDFLLDGVPHQVRSGAIHYFRVPRGEWADRIRHARLMGLNAVETYVAWNVHERPDHTWDFTGQNDLGAFLDAIAAEGLHAIVRPGPYICAEWDNGGLPWWLTATEGIRLRCMDPVYMAAVQDYLERVLAHVVPRQITRGGPVIMVQIENEYGAYGHDKDYLRALVDINRRCGVDVPLCTCDQPVADMLARGSLPDLLQTGTFGSDAPGRLAILREHQRTGPLMCMEFWNGWFDSVGQVHHVTHLDRTVTDLKHFMETGASFNLYMFHGGTNLGLSNGANDQGMFAPVVSSYDYDAPLAEDGTITPKWEAFRDVIRQAAGGPEGEPRRRADAPVGEIRITAVSSLLGWISDDDDAWVETHDAPTMDSLGLWSGLALYRSQLPADAGSLAVDEIRDHASVFVDGTPVGELDRALRATAIPVPARGGRLDLLVENRGRVNYGPRIGEAKGIIGQVRTAAGPLTGWRVLPLGPADVERRAADARAASAPPQSLIAGPAMAWGQFVADEAVDHFVSTEGWGSGWLWLNGTLVGRHSSDSPATTLYLPASLVRAGTNEVMILELRASSTPTLRLASGPELGPIQ